MTLNISSDKKLTHEAPAPEGLMIKKWPPQWMEAHFAALLSLFQLTACQTLPCSYCLVNRKRDLILDNGSQLKTLQTAMSKS